MPAAPKPFLRFTHSQALRKRTLKVLDAIDMEPDPTEYREALSDIIIELNREGMKYFFLDPMEKLKLDSMVERTAAMGIRNVHRIMAPAVRSIVGRMDKHQLRKVSKIISRMME